MTKFYTQRKSVSPEFYTKSLSCINAEITRARTFGNYYIYSQVV